MVSLGLSWLGQEKLLRGTRVVGRKIVTRFGLLGCDMASCNVVRPGEITTNKGEQNERL